MSLVSVSDRRSGDSGQASAARSRAVTGEVSGRATV
jgi:hypothetical protein